METKKTAQVFDFAAPDLSAEFAAFKDADDNHPYLLEQPVRLLSSPVPRESVTTVVLFRWS